METIGLSWVVSPQVWVSPMRSRPWFCSPLYPQPLERGGNSVDTVERTGRVWLVGRDEDSQAQHEGSGKKRDRFCLLLYLLVPVKVSAT